MNFKQIVDDCIKRLSGRFFVAMKTAGWVPLAELEAANLNRDAWKAAHRRLDWQYSHELDQQQKRFDAAHALVLSHNRYLQDTIAQIVQARPTQTFVVKAQAPYAGPDAALSGRAKDVAEACLAASAPLPFSSFGPERSTHDTL